MHIQRDRLTVKEFNDKQLAIQKLKEITNTVLSIAMVAATGGTLTWPHLFQKMVVNTTISTITGTAITILFKKIDFFNVFSNGLKQLPWTIKNDGDYLRYFPFYKIVTDYKIFSPIFVNAANDILVNLKPSNEVADSLIKTLTPYISGSEVTKQIELISWAFVETVCEYAKGQGVSEEQKLKILESVFVKVYNNDIDTTSTYRKAQKILVKLFIDIVVQACEKSSYMGSQPISETLAATQINTSNPTWAKLIGKELLVGAGIACVVNVFF